MEDIETADLPSVLTRFYFELKKKKVDSGNTDYTQNIGEYKNSTLRAIHVALVRYFKDNQRIYIICNELLKEANNIFLSQTNVNKEKGLGDISSYPPIAESDMQKLKEYFKMKMYANSDPT